MVKLFHGGFLMNSISQRSALRLSAVLPFLVGLLLPMNLMSPSSGQSGERVLESLITKEVPMTVKVKREKEDSFKDMKNKDWAREFELELTNTGNKPIFFVFMYLITDVKLNGSALQFPVLFGRPELGDIVTKASPEEPAIKPGETYVFKLSPSEVRMWEDDTRNGNHPDATRIQVLPQEMSFGDGTGFFVNTPYPPH
jgi:hypothetical protein